MKTSMKKFVLGLMVPAFLLSSEAIAQEIKERTLRFSHVLPKESHYSVGVQKFAELIGAKSGKKITVKEFPNGTLGGDIQTVSALRGGTIDLTIMPPGLLVGLNKEFGVFDLPFLFNDFAEADTVLDGPFGKKMMDRMPQGLVGLAYWDHGFRNLSNNKRPIAKMEDINGLKLRALQAPMVIDSFNALGANAVPLPFTELYTALETKAVDGQDNPIVAFDTNKFYDVQKHLSTSRHIYNPLVVMMSKKSWDSLSGDEKKIITDAAVETRDFQRKISREMEGKAIESMKKHGTVITEITPAERARMREKTKPVADKYTAEIGADLVKEVYAEISKVRK